MSISSSVPESESTKKVSSDSTLNAEPTQATYQIKPSVGESFKATKIKEIIDGVLTETLTGKIF